MRTTAARAVRARAAARGFATSQLPTRPLGRTGLEVTYPALGGCGFGADFYGGVTEDVGVQTVLTAVERGINFVDVRAMVAEAASMEGRNLPCK